jgi:hypothetical protein
MSEEEKKNGTKHGTRKRGTKGQGIRVETRPTCWDNSEREAMFGRPSFLRSRVSTPVGGQGQGRKGGRGKKREGRVGSKRRYARQRGIFVGKERTGECRWVEEGN